MVDIYTLLTRQNRALWQANRKLEGRRAEIRRHNENLESMVQERTLELERLAGELRLARDAAEAGSQAKSRFLGIMSHELRTPMNAILGYSRMLLGQGLPPSQNALAKRVVQSSDRLMDLLNSILDYARLGAGGADAVDSSSIPLAPWLAQVCAQGFHDAARKGITGALHLDPLLPPTVRGDARLMGHILAQFVSNSVKFTERGSIEVHAEPVVRDHGRLRLRLSVRDTGIGIPPHIQARLFQPFMQGDDRTERRFEGLGLGLALAREYARVLGGEVGVDSSAGAGSRFWVELDLVPGDEENGQPGAPAAPLAQAPRPGLSAGTQERLGKLSGLLAACDTRAGSWMENLYPELQAAMGDEADTLARLVGDFDYDKAQALIQHMNRQQEDRP
jgi:signal transduction histidine kinase